MAENVISVSGTEMPVMSYQGQRVVTFGMVDKVHQRPNGTAKRNFWEHRSRLVEAEDFWELDQADEIRTLGFLRPQGGVPVKVILLTQSGYLMLVKSFTDDLAWSVQRQMVNTYFAVREMAEESVREATVLPPQPVAGMIEVDAAEYVGLLKEKIAWLQAAMQVKPKKRPISPAERAEIMRLRREGLSHMEIARRLKRDSGTISCTVHRMKVAGHA